LAEQLVLVKVKVSPELDPLGPLINELKKSSSEVGAVTVFVGVVRGARGKEKVARLEYEAHETSAPEAIKTIVEELKVKHGIFDAVVEHKTGEVKVGEDVMYVLVASKHRREGRRAMAELVDRVKREVPIWKKEVTEKGAYWVENP